MSSRSLRLFGFALVTALLLGGCRDEETPMPTESTPAESSDVGQGGLDVPPGPGGRALLEPEPMPGVRFRVFDADPSAEDDAPARPPIADAEPLEPGRIAEILARVPDLPESAAQAQDFALPAGPPPPAVAGETIEVAWPPEGDAGVPPAEAADGPPTVLRYQPEGDVPLASHLAVTFSEPMIALDTASATDGQDVPVTLDPQPEGQWRWVGTRTVLFEPEPRFPMATEYRATVPSGVETASGEALPDGVEWTFRTPPPSVVEFHPRGGPQVREPVIVIVFDQRIVPEDVLPQLRATADGVPVALGLADAQTIAADEDASRIIEGAADGRWMALAVGEPLPIGASVEVAVGPGVPSAEGPGTSESEQAFSFSVFGPLTVGDWHCEGEDSDDRDGPRITGCRPAGTWFVSFSNPIVPDSVDPEAITVEPQIPGWRVQVDASGLTMNGLSVGRTEYEVTLPPGITDVFGQRTEQPIVLTAETGDAPPALFGPGDDLTILDPGGPREYVVSTVNHDALDVTLYRVTPDDWAQYAAYRSAGMPFRRGDDEAEPPGELVAERRVRPEGDRDGWVRTPIDLGEFLDDGNGHLVVDVRVPGWSPEDDDAWRNRPVIRWIQSTQLAVDVFADGSRVLAWVTRLADGAPVEGAEVRLVGRGNPASTDADGLARLSVPDFPDEIDERDGAIPVLTTLDADSTFVTADRWFIGGLRDGDALRWHVFDDRGLYQPGEEAAIKGYLRRYESGVGGDIVAVGSDITSVAWVFRAANGQEVGSGEWDVDGYGAFAGTVTVPRDVQVGFGQLELTVDQGVAGNQYSHPLQIAEFRRPEFEVSVMAEQPEITLGEVGTARVEATYFAGGPLSGAQTEWSVRASSTTYAPPGWDGFTFGSWQPWWMSVSMFGGRDEGPTYEQMSSRTDATGAHRAAVEWSGIEPLSPVSFQAEATVTDVNRQSITDGDAFIGHPAEHYVGLRRDRWIADLGEPWTVDAIVTDVDGQVVTGSVIEMRAERVQWNWIAGAREESTESVGACERASEENPVQCEFTFDQGGRYRITASIVDDSGRANRTELTVWVPGGTGLPQEEGVVRGEVELIPDADRYAPGDTARVLVRAPFAPAEALVTWQRSGIAEVQRLRMTEPSTTIEVPITNDHVPNLHVSVELVGAAPRGPGDLAAAPDRPAYAGGSIELRVPPVERTLDVTLRPSAASLRPGETITVTMTVSDASGAGFPDAQVTLLAVDEAVRSLTNHQIPDPLDTFYTTRPAGVDSRLARSAVVLADIEALQRAARDGPGMGEDMEDEGEPRMFAHEIQEESADVMMQMMTSNGMPPPPATGGGGPGQELPPIEERTDLDPLAAFEPDLVTDANGVVTATISLPDSVTRYRLTAVATDGRRQFGYADTGLTARLPLVVRPSAPRFLNYGDRFELPVVVQSRADEPRSVDVVVRTANLTLTESSGYRVTIPADDRVEVRFPAGAEEAGTAVFQAVAVDVEDATAADAQRVSLPVYTPATTEAFATYGQIDEGTEAQPLRRPQGVLPGFGGLEITTSATALSELSDAFLYLNRYPYEGSEQIASRLLANVAMEDAVEAFGGEDLPTEEEVRAFIEADLDALAQQQGPDGGWNWWRPRTPSSPWVTIHAAHALARAQNAGYEIPEETATRALEVLRDIRGLIERQEFGWSAAAIRAAESYALRVRVLSDDRDWQRAAALLAETGDDEALEVLGWLLPVLTGVTDADAASAREEILRRIGNRVVEEAGTAQIADAYSEEAGALIVHGDRRGEGVVLEALVLAGTSDELAAKLVRGLLDGRRAGRWATTQDCAFALLALDAYFRAFEAEEPDFTADVWLGEDFAGSASFQGRTPDRQQIDVPMAAIPDGESNIVMRKDGPGRLYYRLGLRYAPDDLSLDPSERGFAVQRTYEGVDDPTDVERTADGGWRIRAGARVRVRLTMVAPSRRYHVALVDPLPAGLEALNPALATTETIPPAEDGGDDGPNVDSWWGWWGWTWYDHEGYRDQRVEVFADRVPGGVYRYDYVARATVPGQYVVPPPKAEELYHPETFGRGATERVDVVAP